MNIYYYTGESVSEAPSPSNLQRKANQGRTYEVVLDILKWKESVDPAYFEQRWDLDINEVEEVIRELQEEDQVTVREIS